MFASVGSAEGTNVNGDGLVSTRRVMVRFGMYDAAEALSALR